MRRKLLSVVFVTTVLSLVLAACGSGNDATQAPATTAPTSAATTAATSGPTTAGPTATRPAATSAPTATAVPAATATAAPVSSGEMILATPAIPYGSNQEFDPSQRGGAQGSGMYTYLLETKVDGSFDPPGGLIQSWTTNPDFTQWTFKVRTDIQFHDGAKATSADLKYAIERATDPKSVWAQGGDFRKVVAGADATTGVLPNSTIPDESTFILNLNSTVFTLHLDFISRNRIAAAMPHVIPHSKYVQRVGYDGASRAPLGSGPYKFKSVEIGNKFIAEAVDYKHFFFGTPRIKTKTEIAIPESATRLALMKTKGADMTSISAASVKDIQSTAGLRIVQRNNSQEGLLYNAQFPDEIPGYGKNPLTIKAVRQALYWYAIDREALVKNFLYGYGTPSMDYPVGKTDFYGFVPQAVPKFDMAKAKSMLAAAGYPNGFAMDYWVLTQNPLPEAADIMEAIAAWWEQAGIKVNRINWTAPAFTQQIVANYCAGAPNCASKGWPKPTVEGLIWTGAYRETHASFAVLQHNPASVYRVNGDVKGLELATSMANAKSPAAYKAAAEAYQKYAYEEANTFVMLFEAHELFAASDRVWSGWKLGRDSATIRLDYAAAAR